MKKAIEIWLAYARDLDVRKAELAFYALDREIEEMRKELAEPAKDILNDDRAD